jgi:hypothetical protein
MSPQMIIDDDGEGRKKVSVWRFVGMFLSHHPTAPG